MGIADSFAGAKMARLAFLVGLVTVLWWLAVEIFGSGTGLIRRFEQSDVASTDMTVGSDRSGGGLMVNLPERDRRERAIEQQALVAEEIRAQRNARRPYIAVFNAPKAVPYKSPVPIRIVIGKNLQETLPDTVGRPGDKKKERVRLGPFVDARLRSSTRDVEVIPDESVRILVVPGSDNVVDWTVTAGTLEPFELTLTLTNLVELDSGVVADPGPPVLKRRFLVKASRTQQWALWFKQLDPIWQILGGLASIAGIASGTVAASRWWRRRKTYEAGQ